MIKTGHTEINETPLDTTIHETVGQNNILKILMLEDDENDAELIQMFLRSSTLSVQCEVVSNKEDYIKALETKEYDVILSDHNIPQFTSLEALRIRNEIKFNVPFILVTGAIPEEYAVTILQQGANDYILKDRPQRLMTAITGAINKQKAITEKLIAQQELVKINERLRLVGKATADAIWDWDFSTNHIIWGEGYETLFGYTVKELAHDLSAWIDHIHPEDYDKVYNSLLQVINSTGSYWMEEYRFLKADGSFAFVLDKGIVLRDKNGVGYRMVGAMQDITKIKNLEKEISEEKINHQKQNTAFAIRGQEEERKHIGKELHDNINQLMAFAKMMLDTARNSPEIRDMCIDKSYEGINMAIEEVRKLSHALAPPAFSANNDFIEAVNYLVATIQLQGKIKIKVNILPNGLFTKDDEKIKLTFYRIIQEQLNNILKHAMATKASITLTVTKYNHQLVITDNGLGFDLNTKRTGIGLRNIESRVEVHSGNMEIISAPGKGCTLKVEIPK